MARTVAGLPEGTRVSNFITLGVVADAIPAQTVREVLREVGQQRGRRQQLPMYVVVSYGAVLRCLVEGLAWLGQPIKRIRQTGRAGISQTTSRFGFEPMRRLYQEIVHPVATEVTQGGSSCSPNERSRPTGAAIWRLVSLDSSTLDVPNEASNRDALGRPSSARGKTGFPKLRFVSLVECGTHVLFATADGPYSFSEANLARQVIPNLTPELLCIADRYFFRFELWQEAVSSGADLLWRVRSHAVSPSLEDFKDGSYLSRMYPSAKDRRHDRNCCDVREIEYVLEDEIGNVATQEKTTGTASLPRSSIPSWRRPTTSFPSTMNAGRLRTLSTRSTALDDPTHLRGRRMVLRSKTPDFVRQEFYGLLLAHCAVRGLMHEVAHKADVDPDEISFAHRKKAQSVQGLPGTAPFLPLATATLHNASRQKSSSNMSSRVRVVRIHAPLNVK